jgi:CheY-like chemotaxis protein
MKSPRQPLRLDRNQRLGALVMGPSLVGKRVLLIEDETLVAMLLEEGLAELGCAVVGPIGRVDAAKRAIDAERFDCALLDINLRGQPVYPVAELLAERHVPFCFVTGYAEPEVAPPFARRPVLCKPFSARDLAAVIARLTRSASAARP